MDQGIFELGTRQRFTIDEANDIVRVISHFTKQMAVDVDQLINRLEAVPKDKTDLTQQLEAEIEEIINSWNQKVRKLGAAPKGLWMADIDAGDGYFCWKYPEPEILFWHDYKSGFPGRVTLQDYEKAKGIAGSVVIEPNLN